MARLLLQQRCHWQGLGRPLFVVLFAGLAGGMGTRRDGNT
jgi:hypothetical protein